MDITPCVETPEQHARRLYLLRVRLARLSEQHIPDCPTCDGYAIPGHVCPGTVQA